MPRRPRPEDASRPEPTTEELLAKMGEVFATAGEGAALYLFRTHPRAPGAKVEAWLERLEAPPTLEEIRDNYGGGTFRMRLLKSGQRTEHSVLFTIEGRPKWTHGAGDAHEDGAAGSRLERLLERLLDKKDDDEADFRKMMNRAIVARSIGEALRPAPSSSGDPARGLRQALEILELAKNLVPEAPVMGGDVPPWMALAERVLAMMSQGRPGAPIVPAAASPADDAGATAGPREVTQEEIDAFLAKLARELEKGASVDELVSVVVALGEDQLLQFRAVTVPQWMDFIRKQAGRWPVFATAPARFKLAALLQRLQASAPPQQEPSEG